MEIVLYYAPITCALVPYITLTEANAEFEVRPLNFRKQQQRSAGYMKLTPKHKVPLLVIDGKPLTVQQLQGYLFVILAAGNETTQNAISGGVNALLENPDQLDLLCSDPSLVTSAAEEILRWTSPVVQFARTAVEANHFLIGS